MGNGVDVCEDMVEISDHSTTKSISNIKEAKDLMDHGSNPTVVVKSKVIILQVIIHQLL